MLRLLCAAAVLALTATACSTATADPSRAPDGSRLVRITMNELSFSPRTVTVTAGETVTFRLLNSGRLEHEFMVGRDPVPSQGYREDWLERAAPGLASHTHPGEQHLGEGVRVSADWSGNVKVIVPPERGTYEFGCFIAGHYEAGMKGTLVVK